MSKPKWIMQNFVSYYKWWTLVLFFKKVPGCCRENLLRDWCLIYVIKIESKKTVKYLDKVKKDPLKVLKIHHAWDTELKRIYEYNPYKKNMAGGIYF